MNDEGTRAHLEPAAYLEAFHREWTGLAAAAELGPERPVPACPGWSVARLLGHLGAAYLSIAKNIRVGEGQDVVNELEDLELTPPFEDWFRHGWTPEHLPPDVVRWYRDSAENLASAWREAGPEAPTWSWYPPEQRVRFWMRRMTHETAVHRWDVQQAFGRERPIEPEMARDGVDEALTVYMPFVARPESKVLGAGETYLFESIDAPGAWTVRFAGDAMEVRREAAPAGVTVHGNASDLMLFVWHRIPVDRLTVEGDRALLARYAALSPPD